MDSMTKIGSINERLDLRDGCSRELTFRETTAGSGPELLDECLPPRDGMVGTGSVGESLEASSRT